MLVLSGQPADAPRDEPGLRALSGDLAVFFLHGLGSSRPDPITHTLPATSSHSAGGPGPFLESLVYSCLSQGHCPDPRQQDLLWQWGCLRSLTRTGPRALWAWAQQVLWPECTWSI